MRAINSSASRGAMNFSFSQIISMRSTSWSRVNRPNVNVWHRETMVSGTLSNSVVARIKNACAGGSSSVFRRALNAPLDSMCTSSMM